jgi:uncharacterized protein YjiS (DUF1127 family)
MDTTYFRQHTGQARASGRLREAAAWLGGCLERSRQRRDLGGLSDELVKDIGISRANVVRECGRWPWDGPPMAKLGGSSLGRIRRPSAR